MKKFLAMILALACVLALAACAASNDTQSPAQDGAGGEEQYKFVLLVPYLGDQSYYDTTKAGLDILAGAHENVTYQVIEMGTDQSVYTDYFDDVCSGKEYDIVISGGSDAEEYLYAAAEKYPDQLFFDFDYQADPAEGMDNIYCVTYNTAETGYIMGGLASAMTVSDMENANPDKKVGVILGMDIPGMNDFIGGFCQICTENGIQVYIGYSESFVDSAKVKEIALEMYNQGVDVIWQLAGGAGTGVFEAASQVGRYAFGGDSDQYETVGDPALAATIVTSSKKDCGAAIINAVEQYMAGSYPTGTAVLGVKEDVVGLFENEQYSKLVPEEVQSEVQALVNTVVAGDVDVYSVKADPSKWEEIKAAAVAPVN